MRDNRGQALYNLPLSKHRGSQIMPPNTSRTFSAPALLVLEFHVC